MLLLLHRSAIKADRKWRCKQIYNYLEGLYCIFSKISRNFLEIKISGNFSGKIGIIFRGNFRTHNPKLNHSPLFGRVSVEQNSAKFSFSIAHKSLSSFGLSNRGPSDLQCYINNIWLTSYYYSYYCYLVKLCNPAITGLYWIGLDWAGFNVSTNTV